MRRFGYLVLVAWLGSSLTLSARGDVKLPAIIGSNMVLQADMPLPIWGWASPGEEVTVTLGTAKVSTKAGPEGKWQLKLPPQKASDKPIEVTVAGKNTLLLKNVLIGEVWGGSGQSNMQWSVDRSTNKDEELKSAKYPLIRLFLVPNRLSAHPLEDVDAHWVECTPETVPGFSAVLYFFGREIHKVEKVPVGLINVSWGGSRIESWITHDGYASHPELKKELDDYNKLKNDRVAVMAARKQLLPQAKAWVAAAEKSALGRKGDSRRAFHPCRSPQSVQLLFGHVQRHGPCDHTLRHSRLPLVSGGIESWDGNALSRVDEGSHRRLA